MSAFSSIKLHDSWKIVLQAEFNQPYMQSLKAFLQEERAAGKTIYPPGSLYFNAMNTTPFDAVKVVILGQDPYHGAGQAMGLSFSVPKGVRPPPSLKNIFKELQDDLGITPPDHGDLTSWAKQGVLLLNSVLTVEAGKAASHSGKGWETLTDAIISALNNQRSGLVFILWGAYAHKKGGVIDGQKHLVIKSPHPSPFAAHKGFFGSKPFSKANKYLQKPINWVL